MIAPWFLFLLSQTPQLVEQADAVYPPSALRDRIEAQVLLHLEVEAGGQVHGVKVVTVTLLPEDPSRTSTASYNFGDAAKEAALGLRFKPIIVDGQAVPFELDYTLRFTLPPLPPPLAIPDPPPPPTPEIVDDGRYDVVVEATAIPQAINQRALSAADSAQVAGTLGDPVLAIENLPGVARTGFDGGNVVRGSAPADSISMVDGVPVMLETHFGGFRSVIAPQLVERIDFHPGNFSTRYGRRTGGILDVRLRTPEPDRIHGEAELSVLDAGLYLELPIGDDLSVAVAGRRSHLDLALTSLLDGEDLQVSAAPRYYDYQGLVTWRPAKEHRVQVFGMGSDDRMALLFQDAASDDIRASNGSLSSAVAFQRANLSYDYQGQVHNNLQLAIGGDQFRTLVFGLFDFQANFLDFNLRDQLEVEPAFGGKLTAGLDLQHRRVNYAITAPRPPKEGTTGSDGPTLSAAGLLEPTELGAYVEAELPIGLGLSLIPGLRADYYSLIDGYGFDPRLVVRWQANEDLTLRAGAGIVHQLPEFDELVAPFGNPELELIRAEHYSAGVEWRPFDFLSADVTLYWKELHDVVRPTDRVAVKDGTPTPLVYDNGGSGRSYGAEVMLRHDRAHDFEGWLSYTLSRAERDDDDQTRLFDYDQTHILTLVGRYWFGESWSVGARWRLVSGSPVTPILGGIWRGDRDEYEAIPGGINSARLPAFHQLDLRIDKTWGFEDWELSAYLSLSNAYNRANVESLGYNFDYSQSENVSGLPLLPILGAKGRF
jgi:TonB family protein